MAKISCSIEMEPRTLNVGQISHAVEAAADVVQKMEPKEASDIFFKGLRPVVPIKEMDQEEVENRDQCDEMLVERIEKVEVIGTPCQCLCTNSNVESPCQTKLKEPLSAPF